MEHSKKLASSAGRGQVMVETLIVLFAFGGMSLAALIFVATRELPELRNRILPVYMGDKTSCRYAKKTHDSFRRSTCQN